MWDILAHNHLSPSTHWLARTAPVGFPSPQVSRFLTKQNFCISFAKRWTAWQSTSWVCCVHYGFNLKPLSEEEENFPIAYGILTYKWIDHVLFLVLNTHNRFLSPAISSPCSFPKCGLYLVKSACETVGHHLIWMLCLLRSFTWWAPSTILRMLTALESIIKAVQISKKESNFFRPAYQTCMLRSVPSWATVLRIAKWGRVLALVAWAIFFSLLEIKH